MKADWKGEMTLGKTSLNLEAIIFEITLYTTFDRLMGLDKKKKKSNLSRSFSVSLFHPPNATVLQIYPSGVWTSSSWIRIKRKWPVRHGRSLTGINGESDPSDIDIPSFVISRLSMILVNPGLDRKEQYRVIPIPLLEEERVWEDRGGIDI